MKQYIELLKDVMENGVEKEDRTGVGSRAVFGRLLRWDLQDGFPIQTTRRVPFRIAFEETMFFLRGETDTKLLEEKKINIWKGNTSREFLDARGLNHLPEGDMGHGYGYRWRHFAGPGDIETDQIKDLLQGLKTDPGSRRHVVTGWHPGEDDKTALPPCHNMMMFSVENGKLHTNFIMRSNDLYHGLPFNVMSYALINSLFSKHLGLEQGDLVYFGWDCHIYKTQYNVVNELLCRTPQTLPKLIINKELKTLEDVLDVQFEDVDLIGYNPLSPLAKVEMAI